MSASCLACLQLESLPIPFRRTPPQDRLRHTPSSTHPKATYNSLLPTSGSPGLAFQSLQVLAQPQQRQ